ncbi:MAG: MFS transporter [Alphaproteobacteria bacterium]
MNRRLDDPVSPAPHGVASAGVQSGVEPEVEPGVEPGVASGRAWAVVAAAFFASAVALGLLYSFGVFLRPMAADLRAGTAGAAAFFSIASIVYYALGAPAGRLADRYGPRPIVASGAVILAAGLCATAFVEHLWLAYLTYAIGAGVGGACVYVPSLAAVGGWFVRRRNLALGIAAAGTGIGTLFFPLISATLTEHYGWRAAFVVLGLAGGLVLLGCAALTSAPPVARGGDASGKRPAEMLRSRAFVLLYLSWVFATSALLVPFVFLPAFAQAHGAGEVAAAALISVIGGTGILGRLVLGPLGDRIGVVRLFKLMVLVMALSYAIWLLAAYWWLVVFAVVLGMSYGSRIAAVPAVLIELFGAAHLGTMLGVFFTATGLAAVIGPGLAGLAVELSGGYGGAIVFAVVSGLLGFALILPLRQR